MAKLNRNWKYFFFVITLFILKEMFSQNEGNAIENKVSGFKSEAAKRAKANAEILREIFQVVFIKEPKDRAEFGMWADTLNQGASYEGVYNAFTHSSDYRKLEASGKAASVEALKIFSEELARLELELKEMTPFDHQDALAMSDIKLGMRSMDLKKDLPTPDLPIMGSPTPRPKPSLVVLADQYSKVFVGTSIFTLKRVIGDECIKVADEKNSFHENLALWYSKWVPEINKRKVNFGISERNNNDEAFHYKWALTSTDDQIKWEVLNRLMRVLNEANREKQ